MGSFSSKDASAKTVEPVGIMITKEVAERWQAIQSERTKEKTDDNGCVKENPLLMSSQKRDQGNTENESSQANNITSTKEVPSKHSPSSTLGSGSSSIEDEQSLPSHEIPTQSPSAPVLEPYNNMKKFATFFVHKDSQKLRDGIENGEYINVLDSDVDHNSSSSFFLGQPRHQGSQSCEKLQDQDQIENDYSPKNNNRNLPEPEIEVKEPIRNNRNNSVVEGQLQNIPEQPLKVDSVRVSKSVLPVVVDQDPYGVTTIETITAWKMKGRMQEELWKNNTYWSNELRRLTAKIEDETTKEAQNFQMRCETLEYQHPDIVSSVRRNISCNHLTSRIGKCYKLNQSQVLKCNGLVRQFATCTNSAVEHAFKKVA